MTNLSSPGSSLHDSATELPCQYLAAATDNYGVRQHLSYDDRLCFTTLLHHAVTSQEMLQLHRLRLLLAATFISATIAQADLPSQISAAGPLATSAPSYPTCATNCLAGATGTLLCEETDTRCLCSHQRDVRSSVEACLAASNECSQPEAAQAAGYYETVCRALGLDQNGEPSLSISSGGIATATDVAGLIPTSGPPPTPTSASVASSTPSSTSSASPNRDETEEDDKDDNGLSVASVAGIAAGCAFIAVAIITALIWMYIKRRDEDHEMIREIESQPKKSGFEGGASSVKTATKSEKDAEFAMTALPPKSDQRSPRPPREHDRRPTLAERRHKDPAHLARTPSESIKESRYPFPFGDKIGAEASVTSLTLPSSAGKPVSAVIVQNSPTRTQFSDAGSIYSVSSIHSEEAYVTSASEARLSRPMTFYNLYSGGQDGVSDVNLPKQPAVGRGQGSLRQNKFDLQVTTPTLQVSGPQPSPNPFTTPPGSQGQQNPFATPKAEPKVNPFESADDAFSPVSPQERLNPLAQNPGPRRSEVLSAGSFGKFDFEISQEDQTSGRVPTRSWRDSFFNSLDTDFDKQDFKGK